MKIAIFAMAIVCTACTTAQHKEKINAWEKFRKDNECRLYQDEFTVPGAGSTSRSTKPIFICQGKLYQRPF